MNFLKPCLIIYFLGLSQLIIGQKINGVSFVSSRDSITQNQVLQVKNVSANYVALIPFGFIKDLKNPNVYFDSERQWFGETEKGIRQYASQFKIQGINIMVKPQIWVWKGEFTGHIKMNSEQDWKTLEDSYEHYILTFANTAKAIGATIFCIGTELESFVVNRPLFWKQLIAKIRRIYKGKITYASNWNEFSKVPFWELLDYVGVDAYFPLSKEQTPTIVELIKGWQQPKKNLYDLSSQLQISILFTEFGYRSVDYTAKQPWDVSRLENSTNYLAQLNSYKAIFDQFWKETWFAGGFVWKWFPDKSKIGKRHENRFTPQNKLAEEELQKQYSYYP